MQNYDIIKNNMQYFVVKVDKMKYAIDRFVLGFEVEVSANDIDATYIPKRKERFYCPECGEIVYFRSKGGSHPSQFYHKAKTPFSPECEKRVDGISNLYLYQRIGLPMFLTGVDFSPLTLNIGFPPLGNALLTKATKEKAYITISEKTMIRIDSARFFADQTTLIPVDFIPRIKKNYTIDISDSTVKEVIKKRWSDYSDGIMNYNGVYGAIFYVQANGGKKVRIGDSISTFTDYYLITTSSIPSNLKIRFSYIRSFVIDNMKFVLYIINIDINEEDVYSFAAVNNYLKKYYGIWLLKKQPEIIPLWPPVVENDGFIPVNNEARVICAVSSGNEKPKVFNYQGTKVNIVPVFKDQTDIFLTLINIQGKETIVSVDRKYAGRELIFKQSRFPLSNFTYEFNILNDKDEIVELDSFSEYALSLGSRFCANSKAELYIGAQCKQFSHFEIRNYETLIPQIQDAWEIYILVETFIVFHKLYNIEENNRSNNDRLVVELIEKNSHGQLVSIPRWTIFLIQSLRRQKRDSIYMSINSAIKDNKIYLSVLVILRRMQIDGIM